jgi:hypothetical protein
MTAASMTKTKPQNSNSVSFATVNNTPAEITEIMPKSFRLGDSSLKAKANRRRNIGAADLHIVANVTDMKTSDSLLRFISIAVPSAVGTTLTK